MTKNTYIPVGAKVMTPTGRHAEVVRYTQDGASIGSRDRAICRYLDSKDGDTVTLPPRLLREVE